MWINRFTITLKIYEEDPTVAGEDLKGLYSVSTALRSSAHEAGLL